MKHIFESTLLLVDDNAQLREMVTGILRREGFLHIECACCVAEAERYFRRGKTGASPGGGSALAGREPDLVILDINLPDGDGFSLMQKIRTVSDVPVLFLSARDEDGDRLLGLGLGADDYMVKPFLPKELTLRVSAILKRTYFPANREEAWEKETLELGECRVDFRSGTVLWKSRGDEEKGRGDEEESREDEKEGWEAEKEGRRAWEGEQESGGREISLTAKELLILRKLWENKGNIVTFDQLCQAVWEDNYFGYENTIMVHIRRLREKIEENPSKPRFLLTVRGLGYKLKV